MTQSLIRVQESDFDVSTEIAALRKGDPRVGAVVTFLGTVRDLNDGSQVKEMTLEHYPGMTEKSLFEIENKARKKWHLEDVFIVHRVGELKLHDPIVGVIVLSTHRKDAFDACAFIMDYLKTEAPFWKKENKIGRAHV